MRNRIENAQRAFTKVRSPVYKILSRLVCDISMKEIAFEGSFLLTVAIEDSTGMSFT